MGVAQAGRAAGKVHCRACDRVAPPPTPPSRAWDSNRKRLTGIPRETGNPESPSIRSVEAAHGRRVPELVGRTQSGDRTAFDQLYRDHVNRVYAICLRMSGNATEAERLTQDAFVKLWRRIESFRGQSEFTTWLYRLTVNVVLEDSRSTRERTARVDPVEDLGAFDRGQRPEAEDTETRMEIEHAIATLPPGARYVLVMHDIEGYKHEEIAQLTGTTTGSVKAQLHRARKLLRERLTR